MPKLLHVAFEVPEDMDHRALEEHVRLFNEGAIAEDSGTVTFGGLTIRADIANLDLDDEPGYLPGSLDDTGPSDVH